MLHTDIRILPERKRIWSSWNYCIPKQELKRAVITYDMNILQNLRAPEEFCVTLNRPEAIARDRVIGTYNYTTRCTRRPRRRRRSVTAKSAAPTAHIMRAPTGVTASMRTE